MTNSPFSTRLAPTPSGYLHTGNAYSFLLTAELAQKLNGKLLLRIDDLDAERKRPEYLQDIFDSLHWLGIEWDQGPKDAADFEKNWSQLHRIPLYNETLQQLIATGDVYSCSCSRRQLNDPSHQCTCREKNIPFETPGTALRIEIPERTKVEFDDLQLGRVTVDLYSEMNNFVVRKKDGTPAYQLASLVDDLHFGITHIVRGEDLLASTAAQLYLAQKINREDFSKVKFLHHQLLKDESGNKLSKSEGALSLKALREKGIPAEKLISTFDFKL